MREPQSFFLRNGTAVRLRPIRSDDASGLMALCERLSPQSVYQRFFTVRRMRPADAQLLADVDYQQRMAIVAEIDEAPERVLIGVARYAPSADGTTDLAFVVADAWHGQGLGSLLLEALLRAGEERGIYEFSADVLGDNHRALALLRRYTTITSRTLEYGVIHLVFHRRATIEAVARAS
jgi:GNAT superfamily N-acetyltransferase